MALENILSQEIVQKLGWTLLHFVWQAAAVALLLGILLALLRKSSANLRYIVACAALGLIVLLPIATLQLVSVSIPQPAANVEPAPPPAVLPVEPVEETPLGRALEYMEMAQPENVGTAPVVHWKQQASDLLEPALPYIVSAWLLGVFGLSLWHLGGWAQLQRLRKKMIKQVDDSVHNRLCQLSEKLHVKQAVQLLESALVQVPTVVGWLRPVILLPASALTGLSSEQLEALLAHELAHIRRYDYLVNMLQTLVETLGFYHPAVWWISHKIRIERENCCDDLAISISGDRVSYARALTSMEEIRGRRGELAVAAAGGNLFGRIRRLVGKDSTDSSRASWIPSVITILLIAIIAIPTTLALTANDKTPQSAQFLLDKMLEHRSRVKNLQYVAENNIWRDLAAEQAMIEDQIKSMRESGISERQLERFRQSRTESPESRYQILRCTIDDEERVKIEQTGGTYDSSGKKVPRGDKHIWAWNGVLATDFSQRSGLPASATIRNTPQMATRLGHPWKSFTGIFCGLLEETIAAEIPVSVEKLEDDTCRIAFDYKTRRIAAIINPSQGYTCPLQEYYNEQGRLTSRSTVKYEEVAGGIWFPVSRQIEDYSPNGSVRYRSITKSSQIRINDPDFNAGYFDVDIPKGTTVRDEVQNKQYVVGSKRVYELDEPQKSITETEEIDPNSWQEKFYSIYRLEDSQVLKRIAPPFIPERRGYLKSIQPGRYSPNTPPQLVSQYFNWDGKLSIRGARVGGGIRRLNTILGSVIGLGNRQYDIPSEILSADMSGDWIVRKDTPQEELLQALEQIVKDETSRDIDFVRQNVETEVIIAEGKYNFQLLPNITDGQYVLISTNNTDTYTGGGGGSGTLGKFLHWVGNRVGMNIIDETESEGVKLSWRNHDSSELSRLNHNAEPYHQRLGLLLNNLSRQTGITFNRKTATVEKWFITENGAIEADRKTDALVESDEGRIEGRIIDINTGKGISSVQLAVVPNSSPALSGQFVCTSAEDGTFAIGGLRSGEYHIRGDFPSVDVDVVSGRSTKDVLIGVRRGETVPAPIETTAEQQGDTQIMIGMRVIEMSAEAMKDVFEPNESLSSGFLVRHGHEIAGRLLTLAQERKDAKLMANPNVIMLNNSDATIAFVKEMVYTVGYESAEGEPGKLTAQNKFLEVGWKFKIHAKILESGEKVHMELAVKQQESGFETRQYRPGYDYQIPSPPDIFVAEMTAKNGEPFVISRLRPGEPVFCLIVTPSALVPERQPEPLLGKKLPEPDNIQNIDDLKQAEGKRILVCFWDMNQRPSRNFIGELARREKELTQKDVVVLLVHTSNVEPAKLKEWLDNRNIPFACGSIEIDAEKVLFAWGVRAQPWLILTDEEGVVRAEGFNIEQLDEKLQAKSFGLSLEEERSRDNLLAKSVAPSGVNKSVVRVDLSVVEVFPGSKMDRETTILIENLLGDKITIPDPPAVADLLRKAAEATAAVEDESAGDKRVTQEQFDTLVDTLVSRGFVKILMNPTLEVVDGGTAQIRSEQKIPSMQDSLEDLIQITPNVLEDSNIILQVEATFSSSSIRQGKEQTPIISTCSFASMVRISSGQSQIIGGMIQPAARPDTDGTAKVSQTPARELMCIVTASIIAPAADEVEQSERQHGTEAKEPPADKPMTRVYDISDLVGVGATISRGTVDSMMGGSDGMMGGHVNIPDQAIVNEAQKIVNLIMQTIDPNSWYENDPNAKGIITPFPVARPRKLAIYQTLPAHQQIQKLLESRREQTDITQISIEMRYLYTNVEFLDEVRDSMNIEFTPDTFLDDKQLETLLRASQKSRDIRSMMPPSVRVLNNETVRFKTVRQIFMSFLDYPKPNNVSEQSPPVPVDTFCIITPHIEDNKDIIIDFVQDIPGLQERIIYDRREMVQSYTETTAITNKRIPNNKTFAFTCNIRKVDQDNQTASPAEKKTLIVLIKPTIIVPEEMPRSEAAATILNSQRSKGYTAEQSDETILLKPAKEEQPGTDKDKILFDTKILTVSDEFLKYISLDPNSVANSEDWSDYLVHSSGDSASFVIDQLHEDLLLRNVAARMRTHKDIQMLHKPQVLAANGKKCEIHILESEYYMLGPPSEPNALSGESESKSKRIELGTTIRLTPNLTLDRKNVNLDFEWESRQLRGFKEHPGPDGNVQKIPQVDVESIKTPCTVPDGKTLLITGKHITLQKKKEPRKPRLADLPLIGRLFYSPPQVEETRNLLILVKPIFDPQKIAQATRPTLEPLDPNDPLIKQIEEKFKRSNEKN